MNTYWTLISHHVQTTWDSLCAMCLLKVWLGGLLAVLWYLLGANNHEMLGALVTLMAIDFVTAIWGAYASGEIIESRRALKSASKLIVYLLFIAAGHLTSVIVLDVTFTENAVISFLALTELVSIMENIGKMGYMVPQRLLNRLQDLRNSK